MVLDIFYITIFFKVIFFNKTEKKQFWGHGNFFNGRGHFMPKINITFFVENQVLSIFSYLSIFSKEIVFSVKTMRMRF